MPQPKEPQPPDDAVPPVPAMASPGEGVPTPDATKAVSSPDDGTIAVRLKHRPFENARVRPSELPQLRSQGLLINDKVPSGAPVKAPRGPGKEV